MNEELARQSKESYDALTEDQKHLQASFWAVNFLLAELAGGLRLLRTKLVEKGLLSPEEDTELSAQVLEAENLQAMYRNTERAFNEKYYKVRYALENPEAVRQAVEENRNG